jgi:ferrous iron transport protein A
MPVDSGPKFELTLDRADNQQVQVLDVLGGPSAAKRLAALGIRTGETLRVLRSAPMSGPVLVEIGGAMVAVGRGLAAKVRVKGLA